MHNSTISQSRAVADRYPSRNGGKPRFIERTDPVVYGPGPRVSREQRSSCSALDAAAIEHYGRLGFVILEGVFNSQEVALFQQEQTKLLNDPALRSSDEVISEASSGDIRSIFRVHELSALFKKLSSDIRLAGSAQRLLGDQVYIHQSRLNYKPGFRGREFYWHSDFETWHVEDGMPAMRALSMSVTLTENHEHNGPLMLIPGSHKRFLACQHETPDEHFRHSLKKQEYGVPDDENLAQMVADNGIVSATCKPGSVIIFDCNMMHGSNSNITPSPRSNVFIVYNALSNRVGAPFCEQPPRPEYICAREHVQAVSVSRFEAADGTAWRDSALHSPQGESELQSNHTHPTSR